MISILITAICIYCAFYLSRRFLLSRGRAPGPWCMPIFGYLPFLNPTEPHVTLKDLGDKYGPIYGMYLGSIYTVVLSDANLVREALKRDEFTGRAPLYVTHGIMGGYGIICAEGNLWKDQRKLSIEFLRKLGMTKYGGQSRNELEKRILRGIYECLDTIESERMNRFTFDPLPALNHSLGNVLNDLVFGVVYKRNDETWSYLQHLQEEGVKHIGVSGVVNFLPFLRFLPSNEKIIKFLKNGKAKTHKIYDQIISKCQMKVDVVTDDDCAMASSPSSTILEMFLKERRRRTEANDPQLSHCCDVQLRHLLADLYGAGVDTTLTTLRWLILFIARDVRVQEKIHLELSQLYEAPRMENYDDLIYLRACISETQRIRSVVPLGIPHGTTRSTELNGFHVPKGAMIIPLQWAIHMSEKNWTSPEVFNPERFIDEDGKLSVPNSFIPFQSGKRMCFGDDLAKMLMFLFAANLLYRYKITHDTVSDHGQKFEMKGVCGITLTPPKYQIYFEKKLNK